MEIGMKIQFLNGGLANQAFQYIFAKYYELSFPGEVMYMDDSYFAIHTVHNGYELEKVFGIKPHFLSECFDEEVWSYMLEQKREGKSVPQILNENGIPMYMISEVGEQYKNFNPFDGNVVPIGCGLYIPSILQVTSDVYYHGYWINKWWMETYKTQFLQEFTFAVIKDSYNKELENRIKNSHSVSIHIRRGDYVNLNFAYEVSHYYKLVEMFRKALEKSEDLEKNIQNWNLFVFSDDIHWCKEHRKEMGFDVFGDIQFVEGNIGGKNYIDMQLMSQCEAMIICNSAFSYLAALLNTRRKLVINPTQREI